jgi:hypothetical protein
MSMVREAVSSATGRQSATVLSEQVQGGVLVRTAAMERASHRPRHLETIDDIRSGDPAACTLLLEAASRAPVAAPPWQDHPVPELPRVASLYTPQDELEAAMARAIAIRRR